MQQTAVGEVVRALLALPAEQVTEVRDFVLFLQARYGRVSDVSDAWSDEDIADLAKASLMYHMNNGLDEELDDPAG